MKPLLRRGAVPLALAASLCGCTHAAAPRTPFAAASPLTTDPGMMSRPVVIPRTPGADPPLIVCVDPSLDVALLFADSVLAGGSRPGAPGQVDRGPDAHLVDLALRIRTEAAALRDALRRLCGAWGRQSNGSTLAR
jgi:hypothetical protein